MSNYPPGVTGNEFAIAGPDWDGTVERVCEAQDVEVVTIEQEVVTAIENWKAAIGTDAEEIEKKHMLMWLKTADLKKIDQEQCPYEGKADAWSYGGVLHWTCPMCGAEHEEELYDE